MKTSFIQRIVQFTLNSVGYDKEKLPCAVRVVTTAWGVKMEQAAKTRHTERCPVCHRFIRHGERHNHAADEVARAVEKEQRKELPSVFSDTPLPAGTICRGPKSTRYIVLPFDVKAEASLPCGLCGLCGLGVCSKIKCGSYERRDWDHASVYFKELK